MTTNLNNSDKKIRIKPLVTGIFFLIITSPAISQIGIDSILATVTKNNKELQAIIQFQKTRALELKTGLTLPDPAVEYDYYKESNSGELFQHDLLVKQSFDFPTTYINKKKLSDQRILQSTHELTAKRQEILLETKMICIQLIYLNRLRNHLAQFNSNATNVRDAMIKRLNSGEGNQLEVNKARLQLLDAEKQIYENRSMINIMHQKLAQINGGQELLFPDTAFAPATILLEFEKLEQEFEKNDPHRKMLEEQNYISQIQLELSRSASLPKMQLGYRYQSYPEQSFNGIHGGITIPLWENKNNIKFRKAELVYSDLILQTHLNDHYYEIKQLYEKFKYLNERLNAFREAFNSINTVYLLSKAFNSGHISLFEYYYELNFYNTTYQNYLETERDYHEVIAELNKYKL